MLVKTRKRPDFCVHKIVQKTAIFIGQIEFLNDAIEASFLKEVVFDKTFHSSIPLKRIVMLCIPLANFKLFNY